MDAKTFDSSEPTEKLPNFPFGTFIVETDNVIYNEFHGLLFIETTVKETLAGELESGARAKVTIDTNAKSKLQEKYVAERVKGFLYPALGRRKIDGAEVVKIVEAQPDGTLNGKTLKLTVRPDKKKRDDGTPWPVYEWEAVEG